MTYPRTANNEKELTVVRGEFLEVLDSSRKWWKTRNIQGQVGIKFKLDNSLLGT